MKWITLIVFLSGVSVSFGQQTRSLQQCLELAVSHSLHYSAASGKLRASRIDRQFHRWNLLPDLSATASFNTSFGRRLDPFTNTFASSSVNSNSFGMNAGIRLFNGGDYFYKRNHFNKTIQLDQTALLARQNELKIAVIQTYFKLCRLAVQTRLTTIRREHCNHIREIQELLLHEGRISVIDTLKNYNTLLAETNRLLDLEQETKRNLIELNFQTGLALDSRYEVDLTSIASAPEKPVFPESFRLEALALQKELLTWQLQSERAKLLPSVSFNALLGTGFSTNNKDYSVPGNPTKAYREQISQNLYEGIGLYVSIPLFDRGDWLKAKQKSLIEQETLEQEFHLAERILEKQRLEKEQQRLANQLKLQQSHQMENSLEGIYTNSLLLYREGRITYTELDDAWTDWQIQLAESALLTLEIQLLNLYE